MVTPEMNETFLLIVMEDEAVVGLDVVKVVQRFFTSGQFENDVNKTNVVLIPKTRNPERMTDLRPIALCNVLYKSITKVMANRLKPVMDKIVSQYQSALIPERLITDNNMVSFEVLHYLKRKRWGKEASYSIIHGGKRMGPISPQRGIRQHDTLSPYIFTLCAKGFSALIRKYESRGWLHSCKLANGAPRVSHILFVDDNYLYCKATMDEATKVHQLLTIFEQLLGQQVNFGKSSIFYNDNTDLAISNRICSLLQMVVADENGMYLGLPSTMGRNKNVVLGYLKERVRKKQGWRLLTNTNSLVSRIFKARYYPNGSYLSAPIGNNPSFIWHSIFEAQNVVKMGARWMIGIDSKVVVKGELWLSLEENPFITSTHPALNSVVFGNLMEIGSGRWDMELLHDLCNNKDVAAIVAVPILQHTAATQCWEKVAIITLVQQETSFLDCQDYGYGIVARDEHGFMLEGVSRLCHGSVCPELAEAIGVREALSWIKDKQWPHVILETNCLVVVQAIPNPIHMISLFGDVIKECQNLLVSLSGVAISFVKRSANLVAHAFAKAAISYPDRIFSMRDVPTELLPCLVAEFKS
uniref:RNase H type-1 domain-containing protein n=1 Tax=Cannabis sativa TaxID=3483 RepID=A0A803QFA4_CANSA